MRILRNLLDSKTKSASGSDSADLREGRDVSEARGTIELYAVVTAVGGGGGSLTIQVDDGFYVEEAVGTQSATNGSQYRASILSSPIAISATGTYLIGSLTDYGTLIRFSWIITAATSFTFEIYTVYEVAD